MARCQRGRPREICRFLPRDSSFRTAADGPSARVSVCSATAAAHGVAFSLPSRRRRRCRDCRRGLCTFLARARRVGGNWQAPCCLWVACQFGICSRLVDAAEHAPERLHVRLDAELWGVFIRLRVGHIWCHVRLSRTAASERSHSAPHREQRLCKHLRRRWGATWLLVIFAHLYLV